MKVMSHDNVSPNARRGHPHHHPGQHITSNGKVSRPNWENGTKKNDQNSRENPSISTSYYYYHYYHCALLS